MKQVDWIAENMYHCGALFCHRSKVETVRQAAVLLGDRENKKAQGCESYILLPCEYQSIIEVLFRNYFSVLEELREERDSREGRDHVIAKMKAEIAGMQKAAKLRESQETAAILAATRGKPLLVKRG